MTPSSISPIIYRNNKNSNIVEKTNNNVLNIIKNIQNNENCLDYSDIIMKKMLVTLVNEVEKLFNRVNHLEDKLQEFKTTKKYNRNLIQENQQLQCQVVDFQENSTPDKLCCVCMANVRTHINTKCGHMSVCETCSYHLEEKCPICRTNGNFIKVIVS
jgi:hypothetical protein